jgi:MFS family permease
MIHSSVYHGWWIIFAAAIGLGLGTMPLVMASYGVFIKPLAAEFGWSRSETAAALTFHVAGIILSAPIAGRLIDRLGARRLILISYPLSMTVIAAQYFMTASLWHLYASYFLIAILGSGASPIAYTKIICIWFEHHRGLALGLSLSGVGLGSAFCAMFAQAIVSNFGWREAYVALAAVSLFIGLPIVYWLLKDHPSQMRLSGEDSDVSTTAVLSVGITPREARRGSTFWLTAAAFTLVGLGYGGVAAHLIPLLTDRGFASDLAAAAQASVGISLVIGRISTGYLLDHIWGPRVAAIAVLATSAGIGLLILAPLGSMSFVGACLLGLAAGAEIDVMAMLLSRYFGTRYFASLFGQLSSCFFLGTALGPVMVGMSYDMTQSYAFIAPFLIIALLVSASFFCCSSHIRSLPGLAAMK